MLPLPPVAIAGLVGVSLVALLVALVVGVLAGRSGRRLFYLVVGIVVALVFGIVTTALNEPPNAIQADRIGAIYVATIPLVIAFVAGWLCARGSWFTRIVVIIVALVALLAFPYAAAATATAAVIPGG